MSALPWEYHYQFWQRVVEVLPTPPPEPIPEPDPASMAAEAELQQKAKQLARRWSMLNTSINALTQSRRWQR